ncbi:hypothetical protein LX83_004164 [Goodfellowiella coeruleoviolacea]|uniref:Uncharacterized protein n=1 Tax=Goodfellowiella coeruleoviolacea TaxID=334858 RepID=A0AAE3GFH5_9PSEU|nr:hypothetical protein [Goodfellowiella coeruleoviolacea]
MTAVPAGWALISKRPDTYDDYAVLAASRAPFTARQFNQIVVRNSPGDPPASHETGAAALPWVWFTRSKRGDTTYVGVAIRDWTADFDATNRPIAETRYFCVALDDFLSAGFTYSGLYEAVRGIGLADRDTDDPVELTAPAAPPPVETVDFDVAATAAAGLLTGSVALLGGGAELAERLAVLDAVAALLPSGAKAWLTAAGWADFGVNHPLRLAFTARARTGDLAVDLRGTDRPGGGESAYRERLLELARGRGADAVRRHLAGLGHLRACDPVAAVVGLEELDRPRICVSAARSGRLTPELVRQLDEAGRFGDLTPDEHELVVRAYFEVAQPRDMWADRALLAGHRLSTMDELVEEVVRTRAPRSFWTADDLLHVAGMADAAGAHAGYVRALRALGDAPLVATRIAPVVGRLVEHPQWSAALAPLVASSDALSVAVLRRVHGSEGAVAPDLLDLLDREHGDRTWGRYRRLFAAGGQVDPGDLAELNQVDGDAVPLVLRVAQHTGDTARLGRLFEAFLGLARAVGHALRPSWLSLLRDWPDPDPAVRAALDVALCRAGEPPRQDLVVADERYWNALVAEVDTTPLTLPQQQAFGDALAAGLHRGWGGDLAAFRRTLGVLSRLADPHTRPHLSTPRLVARIADEVAANPAVLGQPWLQPWLPQLELDPRLRAGVLRTRLYWIEADATPHEVAALVARVHASGVLGTDEIAPIVLQRWRPAPSGWMDFLLALNTHLLDGGDRNALGRCVRWAEFLMADGTGSLLQPAALHTAQWRLLPQLQLLTHLMRMAVKAGWPEVRSEAAVTLLRRLHRQVGDLLRGVGAGERGAPRIRLPWARPGEHESE